MAGLAELALLWVGVGPAPAVEVEWANEVCVPPGDLRGAVERHLGPPAEGRERVPVRARVDAALTDASSVIADVTLTTPHGQTTRTLESASCEAVHDAVVLLVAMHVDPLAAQEPEPDPLEPAEPDAPPSSLVPTPDVQTEPPPQPRRVPAPPPAEPPPSPVTPAALPRQPPPRTGGLARLDVGATAGPLPGLGPAIGLALGVTHGRARAELRARYLTPQRESLDADGGRGALLQLWTAGAAACFAPAAGDLSVPLCAVAEAGAMRGWPRGLAQARSGVRAYVGLHAEAALVWWVRPRFGLRFGAHGGGSVVRPRFDVEGSGVLYIARPWMAGAAAGVEVRFP